MKKLIAVFVITLSLLVFVLTQARADEKNKLEKNEGRVNIKIESTSTSGSGMRILNKKEEDKIITQIKIKGSGKDHPDWKGFHLKGIISNVTPSSFDINGKTIKMDANVTGKVQIKGNLVNGAFVKVEGKVVGETFYAKETKVENKEIDEDDEDEISPTVTITPTPQATTTPTPTGTVAKRGNIFKINITGNLEDVIKALESLLASLKLQL